MVQQMADLPTSSASAGLSAIALTPALVRGWIALAAEVLSHNAELLNGLNVFPVADSDTGSNLAASMRGAATAIAEAGGNLTAPELLALAARGALRAGRGNSGVILSEWLRGFAQSVQEHAGTHSPTEMAYALAQAAKAATEAVAKPAPGTILTAAQAAADAVSFGVTAVNVPQVAVEAARQAAIDSPNRLAALARAGVPDAGACGLVYVLGALLAALAGVNDYHQVDLGFDPFEVAGQTATELTWAEGDDADEDGFEVMFTLRRPATATEFEPGQLAVSLRHDLSQVGNSVVVVGGMAVGDQQKDSEWHAHVHVSELAEIMQLITQWQKICAIESIQIRHLAVPASDLNVWVTERDPVLIAEYARAGAVVIVPSEGISTAEEVVSAVKASPTTANIVLDNPTDAAIVAENLTYPTDVILGPANSAAEALLLMVINDQVTAVSELEVARETANRMVTAESSVTSPAIPAVIQQAVKSGLVVAAIPQQNGAELSLEPARVACEQAGAELVVIQRGDHNSVIEWAAELPDEN